MSYRAPPSGIAAELKKKSDEKRDPEQEETVMAWIEAVLGKSLDRSVGYENLLQDGALLCQLINKIEPGSVKRVNENPTMPFKAMENIDNFLRALTTRLGVSVLDLFQTVDLFEQRDIPGVTKTVVALGRACQMRENWSGPILGPRQAKENKREFPAGVNQEVVIGLQMGSNKGASQSGMTMGKQRMIVD